MKNLIIPMAGSSTRYPNLRPKWMLTMPKSGDLMCVESIKGLNLDFFDKIYFTFLKEHEEKYQISNGLRKCLIKNSISEKSVFVILEEQTQSQSETVYKTIVKENIDGFIFIKDSDGFFNQKIDSTDNQISFHDLNKAGEIIASNKSYIQMEKNNIVTNIVEKKVISSSYCVGGYGFKSADEFIKSYNSTSKYVGECFVSSVIFEMILQGNIFVSKQVEDFIDWGTIRDWKKFCSEFSTIFIDLDGTLITNTSEFIPPYTGTGEPLMKNIEVIQRKHREGKCQVIITTARPEYYRDLTIKELQKYEIPFDQLIMGLSHCKRYLINDYSETNPYPSSISMNIERNMENLNIIL